MDGKERWRERTGSDMKETRQGNWEMEREMRGERKKERMGSLQKKYLKFLQCELKNFSVSYDFSKVTEDENLRNHTYEENKQM